MSRKFVLVTQDSSGLGWTKKLLEEGEQVILLKGPLQEPVKPIEQEQYDRIGRGLVEVGYTDPETIASLRGPATYWLFDRNVFPELADQLRADGQKVFGTSSLCERMENDRAYACGIANQYGLPSPPTYDFSNIDDGVSFLEQNENTAFVMKPNASQDSFSTFVPFRENPDDANHELLCYLRNAPDPKEGYILQERKPGVEINVEVWLQNGEPFFAFCCMENKRKWNRDLGEMSGCAGDIVFPISLNTPIIARTIGRLLPFYQTRGYTGFADVNCIIGDNQTWFLEVCNRFGYNSHPNLFLTCALDGFGSIMADWMDGNVETIPQRFRAGFGASITCFIDHERVGIPLYLNPRMANRFFTFDGFLPGADVLLTGFGREIGIFTDHDYTIEEAAESCLNNLLYNEAVSYPDIAYRTDLHKADYHGAPIKRYSALKSMRLV